MLYKIYDSSCPQDTRIMGTNNLNQLVHHQLGSNAFDTVKTVCVNLQWLKTLHDNLSLLSHLDIDARTLRNIQLNLNNINAVSACLSDVNTVAANIEYLIHLSSEICFFEKLLKQIKKVIELLDTEEIANTLSRYEELNKQLEEREKRILQKEKELNNQPPISTN